MSALITRLAPDFTATAVMPDGRVDDQFTLSSLRGGYTLLLFYPVDFSIVCPTEILAFDAALEELHARESEVVGISVDSHYSHLAWRRTPVDDGGIGPIGFPLVADLSKAIARDYGVLLNDEVALRALYLIDREGIVRHAVINDLPLGRSVHEALRMVDALRFHEQRGEVCPANWNAGDTGLQMTSGNAVDHLSRFAAST